MEVISVQEHVLGSLMDQVLLDCVRQRGVFDIDLLGGQIKRAKRFADGEEPGPDQAAIGRYRYVFDKTGDDFVSEVVPGRVEIVWKDEARVARALLWGKPKDAA